MRSLRSSILALALAGVTASCAADPISCTDVGCQHGASLRVFDAAGQPTLEVQGTVTFADGSTASWSCPSPTTIPPAPPVDVVCASANEVWLQHGLKVIVAVSVTSKVASQGVDVDLRPLLHDFAPNGPECGPVCRVAALDVHLAPR